MPAEKSGADGADGGGKRRHMRLDKGAAGRMIAFQLNANNPRKPRGRGGRGGGGGGAAGKSSLASTADSTIEQPAKKAFPPHWGQPPARQSRDRVRFPGGYGHGSGTVKRWVVKNMADDAAAGRGEGGGGEDAAAESAVEQQRTEILTKIPPPRPKSSAGSGAGALPARRRVELLGRDLSTLERDVQAASARLKVVVLRAATVEIQHQQEKRSKKKTDGKMKPKANPKEDMTKASASEPPPAAAPPPREDASAETAMPASGEAAAAAVLTSALPKGTLKKIQIQIEYYFSDTNYRKDKFLRGKADDEGWTPADVLLGFKKLQEHGAGATLSAADLQCALETSELVETNDSGAVKRKLPLPEIKEDPRPLDVRVNEIVEKLQEMLVLARGAPRDTPGGLLLRKPLQHMTAMTSLVVREQSIGNAFKSELVSKCLDGLLATVRLIETIKDINSRDEHLRILEQFAVNTIRRANHLLRNPRMADDFARMVHRARVGTTEMKRAHADAEAVSERPLVPEAEAQLNADILAFLKEATAAPTQPKGAADAQNDANDHGTAAAAEDRSPEALSPSLSVEKEALRSKLEAFLRDTISTVTTTIAEADADGADTDGADADAVDAVDADSSSDSAGAGNASSTSTSSNAGWKDAKLKAYGSSVSGLGFASADIDLCFAIDPEATLVERLHDASEAQDGSAMQTLSFPAAVVKVLSNRIADCDFCELDQTVLTSRIPIIKIKQASTGVECDICVNQQLPMYNTLLLHTYAAVDVRVRQLVLAVKHWARQRGINDASNGTLSSYAWVIMVLHYLQRLNVPLVPNLQDPALVEIAQELGFVTDADVDGFEIKFCHNGEFAAKYLLTRVNQNRINTESVGTLLKGFFHYYAFTFNSIDFMVAARHVNVRGNYAKQNVDQRMTRPRNWRIAIEDPIEVSHDLGNVIFSPEANAAIVAEFVRACSNLSTSYHALLQVRKEQPDQVVGFHSLCEAVPSVSKRVIVCFNCGEEGHISSACPRRGRGGAAAAAPAQPTPAAAADADADEGAKADAQAAPVAAAAPRERPVTFQDFGQLCYICGKPDHSNRDCPYKRACFVCGEITHQARQCPQRGRGNQPRRQQQQQQQYNNSGGGIGGYNNRQGHMGRGMGSQRYPPPPPLLPQHQQQQYQRMMQQQQQQQQYQQMMQQRQMNSGVGPHGQGMPQSRLQGYQRGGHQGGGRP